MELTVAAPAGPQNYAHLDLAGMSRYLDRFNLMGYDYAGVWAQPAAHQSNLYPSPNAAHNVSTPFSTDAAVRDYLAAGVPAHKILLGMPLYGRAFLGTEGMGLNYTAGVGQGSWEQGVYDYKALPLQGAVERMEEGVGGSWSWDEAKGMVVSYDTPALTGVKSKYIRDRGLGGAMWWEASGDKSGHGSLIAAVSAAALVKRWGCVCMCADQMQAYQRLGGAAAMDQTMNTLSYPASKYDNLRAGMPNN